MKLNYRKINQAIDYNEKLPRKVKKVILGKILTKNKIKKYYKNSVLLIHTYPASTELNKPLICPICGCLKTRFVNHNMEWPDVWNENFCTRCGYLINYVDNSPNYSFLDHSEEVDWIKKFNIRIIDISKREKYNEAIQERNNLKYFQARLIQAIGVPFDLFENIN